MDLHMKQFDGTTFGMSVQASDPAFKRMKKNVFTGKVVPHGWHHERTARCVRASDVAAAMGPAGWLVNELRCMETIRWGSDGVEHYIIYEKELEMANQKFEITDIAHEKYPFLHRIRALRDIGTEVKAGDLGGFVEHEGNLSFNPGDDAWVYNDAIIAGNGYADMGTVLKVRAVVCGNAYTASGPCGISARRSRRAIWAVLWSMRATCLSTPGTTPGSTTTPSLRGTAMRTWGRS